ncbi:hypothetical protein AC1031_019297 [Aphanomyces cochlioides]|nr:hypothetical protein AC1031_019297 [Aphanomyces cochlioides]
MTEGPKPYSRPNSQFFKVLQLSELRLQDPTARLTKPRCGVYEDMLDLVNVGIAPAPGPDDIFDPSSLADAATLIASWINNRGFPRLIPLIRCLPRMQDVLVTHAVWMNRIDLAEFLHQQGFVASSSYPLYHLAAYRGHAAVFEWLRSLHLDGETHLALNIAAQEGHLAMVKYLHERDYMCSEDAMDHAAQGGHLDVVQFLHDHRTEGCTEYAMNAAAERGHLEVVRWLMSTETKVVQPTR